MAQVKCCQGILGTFLAHVWMYKTLIEDSLSQQALLPLSHTLPGLLADVSCYYATLLATLGSVADTGRDQMVQLVLYSI